jgi:hypothetical protein
MSRPGGEARPSAACARSPGSRALLAGGPPMVCRGSPAGAAEAAKRSLALVGATYMIGAFGVRAADEHYVCDLRGSSGGRERGGADAPQRASHPPRNIGLGLSYERWNPTASYFRCHVIEIVCTADWPPDGVNQICTSR